MDVAPCLAPYDPGPTTTLRIAAASSDGDRVDQHFGQTEEFLVYDVGAGGAVLVARRAVAHHAQGAENPRDTVCRMLADCTMLLVSKIGPTPREKLAGVGIEASDRFAGKPLAAALAEIFAARTAPPVAEPLEFGRFRLMHVMLRVSDFERSLDFYINLLGMRLLERRDHKRNQFSQAYLGYGAGFDGMALELVFNWSQEEPAPPPPAAGSSFGHIAIQVTGITDLCNRLAAAGVPLPRPPRAQRHGENLVAFIEDPDGHRIELVQLPLKF